MVYCNHAREVKMPSAKTWEQVMQLEPGWRVQLRKPHPCGNDWWEVIRIGADLRLRCLGCGRRVILPRRRVAQRLRYAVPPEGKGGASP